jgi:class 3 adenylate cyclase/tetratricopeptide (TPR) repeat protein
MKCPKCQFENTDDAKFCNQCASRLELVCPECGKVNLPGSKFCNECAHDLTALSPTQAPPVELSFEEKLENIQRYLPGGLTEKILAQRGKIEGERKQVTVMFCDTEGFSTLSEKLGPEKVYSIMDEVFEMLIHKVNEFGGTVNKMTGDGVMALFGAPIALEDAPQRAIRSALAIQREIARFSDRQKAETNTLLRMRIGIHTGPVVVGSLGNDLRVEFTAVGDTVNLASRMEGLAEPGTVYVTDETFKLTEGLFRFEALGEREVKGKEAPVKAYRVIAPSTRRPRFDVSAERGLTPFLGRERELELLIDGLERAKSGRGQAFSIMGEAGVGKSRLLYEFRKAIANEDVTFIEGRCLSYSTNVAYHPVIDLLKSTYDIHEGDNDEHIRDRVKEGLKGIGTDEASTLPYILELLSVKESGIDALNLSPEARKDKTLEALKKIMLKASEMRPLVMAVEDLHWVDKSSEETFKDWLDAISGAQLLLIFTYRPEFVHTWGGKSYHNQVNLNRLSNRETLAMAAHILGTEVMGEDLEELILNKTEGIPFFVEEFIKSLKDLRMIEWKDSGYYLAKDIQEVAIPSTIQEVIMARVDSLPDGAKSVLQTGSAIGREFSCELIKRVTGIPTPEMTPHLSVLRDSELLYERGIFPQATYIFRHSLTQEVAYDSLLLKRRQEIHERIGQAIEELYPDRLEEFYEMLAYHYSRSGNLEKAYQYLKLSADKAVLSYSLWEACNFGKGAINLLNQMPRTDENKSKGIELRLWISSAMMGLGYHEDFINMLQEGERLSKELSDERSLANIYGSIGTYHTLRGDPGKGVGYLEDAFKVAEKLQDIEMIARVGFQLLNAYSTAGLYFRTTEVAPQIISLLESAHRESESLAGVFNLYSALLATYGYALAVLGDLKKGDAQCEKSLGFANKINDVGSMGYSEYMYGALFNLSGDYKKAVEHLEKAVSYSEEAQAAIIVCSSRSNLAMGYLYLGERDTAGECLQENLELMQNIGSLAIQGIYYMCLGTFHFESGSLDNARNFMEEAFRIAHEGNARFYEGWTRTWLGRILGKSDASKMDEAEESILQGINILDVIKARPFYGRGLLFLSELYVDTDQREKAMETLKKAEGMFQEMGMEYWLRKTQEVLERVEGKTK